MTLWLVPVFQFFPTPPFPYTLLLFPDFQGINNVFIFNLLIFIITFSALLSVYSCIINITVHLKLVFYDIKQTKPSEHYNSV